jgi:alpha-amylase/alpha-mannosidase (GH57 family)
MNRYLCIHGHFYQPPRENAWLEEIELQDSAYPYHDWNERVTAECYAPNTASRILDREKRIINIVNNYTKISFDLGPTLLYWMERHQPEVYKAIIEADRLSQQHFSGHGSAIAHVYNHMIMPLANRRDKRTQIVWGMRDFTHRFGREPEGMWLPETAVDLETLDIMAEHGIAFTILAPHQASRVRKIGDADWHDATGAQIDTTTAYRLNLPSGNIISVFFYDGPMARDVAFGGLLRDGEALAGRLLGAFSDIQDRPQLVHIATDGETYGHHHRHGDMALAYCLYHVESNELAKITIYAEYLAKHPPAHEVEIIEGTSWSCPHGLERWRGDCGCSTGKQVRWNQAWRASLRAAMDWLTDALAPAYEREATHFLKHPWEARDDYIDVILDRSPGNVERFFGTHSHHELSQEEKSKVLKLLEMQRHAMLMCTSCGWFFDDISGLETTQVMHYASRAAQLAQEACGISLEPTLVSMLEKAQSNIPRCGSGARIYEEHVRPAKLDLLRVAGHYVLSSVFEEYPEAAQIYSYSATSEAYDQIELGRLKLAIGRTRVRSDITWSEDVVSFAVLHLGDHNLNAGVREAMGDAAFPTMHREIKNAFLKGDIARVLRCMDKHFGKNTYSLWHLFRDEQRKVLNQILESPLEDIDVSMHQIYERHSAITHFLATTQVPLPKALAGSAEFALNAELKKLLEAQDVDLPQLQKVIEDVKKLSVEVDTKTLNFIASAHVSTLMERLLRKPKDRTLLQVIEKMLKLLDGLPLKPDLWKAQNIYFSICKDHHDSMLRKAQGGSASATKWIERFTNLGRLLGVRCT